MSQDAFVERPGGDSGLLKRLWPHVRPQWRLMVVAGIILLGSAACEMLQPYIIKTIIDDHIAVKSLAGMWPLFAFFVAIVLTQAGLAFGEHCCPGL